MASSMRRTGSWIESILEAVILAFVAAALYPTFAAGIGNLSVAGLALGALFVTTGIAGILYSTAVFFGIYKLLQHQGRI